MDGQLDECELTLRDLTRIKVSFVKILTGIHHSRMQYPEPPAPATTPGLAKKSRFPQKKKAAEAHAANPQKAAIGRPHFLEAVTIMKSEIEKFFRFLQLEKSLATNSIDAYQHDIARYAAFLETRGINSANSAGEDDVAAFIHELHRLGLSARSVARNLSAVKSFHKFLHGEKVTTTATPRSLLNFRKGGNFFLMC